MFIIIIIYLCGVNKSKGIMYYSVTYNKQFRHVCFYHHGEDGRIDMRFRTSKLSPREFAKVCQRVDLVETDEDVENLYNEYKSKLNIYAAQQRPYTSRESTLFS